MTDNDYILRCVQLARNGVYYVAPNPMVGAVLVTAEGDIFAEGWHKRYGESHAEVECFRAAEDRMENLASAQRAAIYSGATLYVSLEPCSHYGKTPPCADLIISKGVRRVVVGCLDPNPQVAGRGVQKLRDAGVEVLVGVEEQACRKLNKRFLCLHEKHRPYVILKWAQTADGFVDYCREKGLVHHADSQPPLLISNEVTKQIVHKMRAENMAIMVGTRTAVLDNPSLLTTRWPGRNPIRVVLDRNNVIPQDAKIFSDDAPTLVYKEQTDWLYILKDLAEQNVHSILVEGGPMLLEHILQSGIWDEMHVEVSPMIIGNGVPAPKVDLPDEYEQIEDAKLYTIYQLATQNNTNTLEK